jgi:hypothetical protein
MQTTLELLKPFVIKLVIESHKTLFKDIFLVKWVVIFMVREGVPSSAVFN